MDIALGIGALVLVKASVAAGVVAGLGKLWEQLKEAVEVLLPDPAEPELIPVPVRVERPRRG